MNTYNIDEYQKKSLLNETAQADLGSNDNVIDLAAVLEKVATLGEEADKLKRSIFYREVTKTPVTTSVARDLRLVHAVLGLQSELAEIAVPLSARIWDGEDIDDVNIMEEGGDLLWYLSILLDAVGYTMSEACQKNEDKLAKRYPNGFSVFEADNRDLEGERETLEAPK